MYNLRAVIPAAGRGTRANLSFPKTLYPFNGVSILHRLISTLSSFDPQPTVIVSPDGFNPITESLVDANLSAYTVIQKNPSGMGDAVLCFNQSPAASTEHVLLVWGDIANLTHRTLNTLVQTHFIEQNDFTFVTALVPSAYTIVQRDTDGNVLSVLETRELDLEPIPGERDIGLFLFRKDVVFSHLSARTPGSLGTHTGEHGFLYVINYLVQSGYRVSALPIAQPDDLISLNSLSDLPT